MHIYILKLQKDKYYIGRTCDIKKSVQKHFNGTGNPWTKKYRPLEIILELNDVEPLDEDYWTKKYMLLYGIDNVRGGTYNSIILESEEIRFLNKELSNARDHSLKYESDYNPLSTLLEYIFTCSPF